MFNGAGTTGSDRPEKSGTSVPLLTIVAIVALLAGAAGGVFFSQGTYDSSTEKRLEYACVLSKEVGQTHPSAEDWGDFEDPAYADVMAAAGLLGGFMPAADDDDKTWESGNRLFGALAQFDPEALTVAVETTQDACDDR